MNIRQVITDRIIEILEKGQGVTRERWSKAAKGGMPFNGKTETQYRGINVLILWDEAINKGYPTNAWITYKQAASMGTQVRKGEKGTMGVYFEMVARKDQAEGADGEPGGFFPMCKPFWVFNAAQIDGLPASLTEKGAKTFDFSPVEVAEQMIAATGATIRHGFDSAYYAPSLDHICMPDRERFASPELYYATAVHELTHWTAHESQLNRQFGKRFGDEAYAMEELVAEMGAAFVGGRLGFVETTLPNHVSYLANWLKVLKSDKTAIFTAAKQASLAFDFLMDKSGLTVVTEEE